MTSRREHLLDAAIRVLGEGGVRAVTHRAVDAEAGLGAWAYRAWRALVSLLGPAMEAGR
jgi:DNA-binding transcriptional regulator YbjK